MQAYARAKRTSPSAEVRLLPTLPNSAVAGAASTAATSEAVLEQLVSRLADLVAEKLASRMR